MQISEISIERQCFGCAQASRLVLRRDGSALLTLLGNARHGTEDKTSVATVSAAEFEAAANLILAHGFFDLADSYENPQLQDGAWATITVQRGTQLKQVFWRDDAGPPALRKIDAALTALQNSARFVATPR